MILDRRPASDPLGGLRGWGKKVQIQLQNMVMLYIKLKGMTYATTWTGPLSAVGLATDACLTADPGVASSIQTRYHTFLENDHEIISMVILLPSADLF